MSETPDKINLLYIASNGRSGSTLLEEVLSNHKKIVTFGELQEVIHCYNKKGRKCSCGKYTDDCEFWGSFKNTILKMTSLKRFRIQQGQGKVLRFNEIFKILFNIKVKKTDQYLTQNYNLFKILDSHFHNRNVDFFIDSSKDPYRLHYLSSIKKLNILVIHIFKHPKAFVYSINKKGKFSLIRYLKAILRYNIENRIIRYVIKKNKLNSINILYDDFCNSTDKELNKVMNNHFFNRLFRCFTGLSKA